MNETEFWAGLAYRVSVEMHGIEKCRRLGLWCDGFDPKRHEYAAASTQIHGKAVIFSGPRGGGRQWAFTLTVNQPLGQQEEINWSQLLPADDVTGWLGVDIEYHRLEIEPGAAVPVDPTATA